MTVQELLADGKLTQAVAQTRAEAARTVDPAPQRLLFDLLCFAGDFAGAEGLLTVPAGTAADDPEHLTWLTVSKTLVEGEKARNRLFGSGIRPRFLDSAPTPAMVPHLEAIDTIRVGDSTAARAALDRAADLTPSVGGTRADGTAFAEIRDADDLLAPALEVFDPAGYFWVGWDQIQYLEVSAPTTLRDLIWTQAKFATFDGQIGEVFLPVLYFGTGTFANDDPLRLGRKTEWLDSGAGIVRGVGRKVFLVGEDGPTVLELDAIQFVGPERAQNEPNGMGGPGRKTNPTPPPDEETPASGAF